MKDEDGGTALRHLPRAMTSPRFAQDVVRSLRAEKPSPVRIVWKFATWCAMVMLLVAGIYAGSIHRQKQQQRLETLRAEHRRIQSELQQVKAIADEAPPVVVLENGDTRVIVDLNRNQQTFY